MAYPIDTTERGMRRSLKKHHALYTARKTDVGLVLTEQCPVGCRHCISACTMQESYDLPNLDTHLDWVTLVAQVKGIKSVTITGGEPFLYFQRLQQVVNAIRNKGLRSNVVTSAYWATSDVEVELKLKQLYDAGLSSIVVSSDEYHQEKIPLTNVARVINAAKKYGIVSGVSITYLPRVRTSAHAIHELRRNLGREILKDVKILTMSVTESGRAQNLEYSMIPTVEQPKLVCNVLTPLIRHDGTVVCCCGAQLPDESPLVIGNLNLDDYHTIYSRFLHHPIIPFIQTWGLIEMLDRLGSAGLASELQIYRNAREEQICLVCQAILACADNRAFFTELFHDTNIRRQLGFMTFVLYGDTALLEEDFYQ